MKTNEAVAALAALAQETRLNVFRLLVQQGGQGLAAGEIAARVAVLPATLSFHLKELVGVGLLRTRPEGRYVYYSADYTAMNRLLAFLTESCCAVGSGPCPPEPEARPGTDGAGSVMDPSVASLVDPVPAVGTEERVDAACEPTAPARRT